MDQLAIELVPWTRAAVLVAFVALATLALFRARHTGTAGRWVAAAFGAIALALLASWVPDEVGVTLPVAVDALRIVLLLLFPYLLLRFTASFAPFPRWLEAAAATALAAVAAATLWVTTLGGGDELGDHRSYVAGALAYWVALSAVSVVRLWSAGSTQPTVARRRMHLMSIAATVLAIALLMAGRLEGAEARLAVNAAALVSAAIFGLGFSPPRALRLAWRRPEEEQLQAATMAVLGAETAEEVADELLPPTVRLIGGGGAAMVDPGGRVLAAYGDDVPDVDDHLDVLAPARGGAAREVVPLGQAHGYLVVWTSPYTPFFGKEESDLLRSMAAIATLALERCEMLAEERKRHTVLEEAQRQTEQARNDAERSRQEATQANAAKTDFLARMSHELRTPLNAILGFGQLLETSQLSGEDREAVGYILKGGRHLLDLINEVLDLAGIESGSLTLSLEPVHVGELINDTLAMIQPLAANRSIQVTTGRSGCDRWVMTDRQRCRQVLLNLLSNAVKYNRDGGEVDVHCARAGDGMLRVGVRDTGPGIDPARRGRLFEPFDRLGAENSGVEGTGLGLALSKQLMQRLGGAIGVETEPGRGSLFWIELPLTDAPTGGDAAEAVPSPPALEMEKTLLLVEDNLANLQVVQAMLRRRPGIAVMPAMQGQIALDLAYEHRPDVVVLDLHLPDLSGREVLHRLRADPRTRDIPIVVASADASPRRVQQLREEGAFDYLTKPLDLQTFLQTVDAALAQDRGQPDGSDGPS